MTAALLVVPGMLLALGLVLIISAFRVQHARLSDALAVIGDATPAPATTERPTGIERIGSWWLERHPQAASPELDRQLQLRGRTQARHLGIKVLCAAAGLLIPLVALAAAAVITGSAPVLPLLACLVLGAVGFILPDIQLRVAARGTDADATEALLMYFDLVTLERLANQSAPQSLNAAASMSDVAVFASIRGALDRARLQQRLPYAELRELGRSLELPALVDLADVMRLDESGASLSSTLRARVRELRNAHLNATTMQAAEGSERMTIVMVVPSLILGLFFLVPPLLTLVTNG
ncbi:MAG: hypothetical protein ACK5LS_12950 [Propioniciclava sp.]